MRLMIVIQAAGNLSPSQYCFRAGKSTINVIMEMSKVVRRAEDHNHFSCWVVLLMVLDVRNSF